MTPAFSDGNSAGANYVYDGAGRLIEAYLPGVTYGYGYAVTSGCPANAAGADTDRTSATITTAAGSTATGYCYDAADRLTSTSSTPGAQVSYDTHGNQLTDGAQLFSYDAADRLVRAEAPGSVDRYLRDPVDRLAARTNITPIVAGGTTSYAAAASGQVSFTVPAGSTAGDLFLASVTEAGTGTMSGTGWTVAGQVADSTGSHQTFVLDHTVTAADLAAGQVTLTVSVPADLVGLLTDYHHGTGVDVTASGSDPAATSQPFPTLTTTRDADTVVHVAGYDQQATGAAPAGDTARGAVSNLLAGLEVSDRYQDLPGPSTPASATSTTTTAAQVLTIALSAAATTTRYGYTGETDTAALTQTATGQPAGTSLTLPGGTLYTTTPGGTPTWAHANLHGDVITTTDNTGTRTWTGYWGPYGEPASATAGGTPGPTDTTDPGTTLGYNATQGKLTDGPLILMGARPYQPDQGRFLTVDPIDGGCANPYTYAYGDPTNHPDLNGESIWGWIGCEVSKHRVAIGLTLGAIAFASGGLVLLAGGGLSLGILSAVTGGVATVLDGPSCRAEHNAEACTGAALGLLGTGAGVAGLFASGALSNFLAAKSFSIGAGALSYDAATSFRPKAEGRSC